MTSFSQDPNDNYVLKAQIDNVRNLSQLLKCILFKNTASCFASSNGLKFVVEDSKCVQIAAFVGSDIFQVYELKEDIIGFRLDMKVLVECLTIFDSSLPNAPVSTTALSLFYAGYGSPLRLVLLEDDCVTDCSIKTLEAEELLHFSMPGDSTCNKIMADGQLFKELLSNLDSNSEYVEVFLSPDPPYFCITTRSSLAKCVISVPKDAPMISEFTVTATAVSKYKFSQIKPAMKPLQAAYKVSLRTDEIGLLCLQCMVQTESKQYCYIEYFCTPIVSDE